MFNLYGFFEYTLSKNHTPVHGYFQPNSTHLCPRKSTQNKHQTTITLYKLPKWEVLSCHGPTAFSCVARVSETGGQLGCFFSILSLPLYIQVMGGAIVILYGVIRYKCIVTLFTTLTHIWQYIPYLAYIYCWVLVICYPTL